MKDLWENIGTIIEQLKSSSSIVLMFDFDGTLSPIAPTPKSAHLPAATKALLFSLSQKTGYYIAIISGRKLVSLQDKVQLPSIIYGGNHGFEGIIHNKKYSFPIKEAYYTEILRLKQTMEGIISQFDGALIEDKKIGFALHFRAVAQLQVKSLISIFNKQLKPYLDQELVISVVGKKIIEVRPKVDWNKGEFANLVIEEITQLTGNKPIALYIGDDTTDEDVFSKLKNGITIRVGKSPKTTAAYYLKNTKEVGKFLQEINQI